jgi:hypothetical protein
MKKKVSSKRRSADQARASRVIARLEDIPNVGPTVAAFLHRLGIMTPAELLGRDPYAMFDDLCRITGQRHDPCLLDTFIAAVRYTEGGPKKPWWKYTAERKRELEARSARSQ